MTDGQLMTLLGLALAAQTAIHVAVRRSTGALSRATRLSRLGLLLMLAGLGALIVFMQAPSEGGVALAPWQEQLLVAGMAAIAVGLVLSLAALANASREHVAHRVSSMPDMGPAALRLVRVLGTAVLSTFMFVIDLLLYRKHELGQTDDRPTVVGYVPSATNPSEAVGVMYSDGHVDNGESMALRRTGE